MDTTNTKPAAWSDEAHERGLQAWAEMEAQYKARRSAAERASDPTEAEAARLAELEAATVAASEATEAAKNAWHDTSPKDVVATESTSLGRFHLLDGFPLMQAREALPRVFTQAERQEAERAFTRADELELAARAEEQEYRHQVSLAGARRQYEVSRKEASR